MPSLNNPLDIYKLLPGTNCKKCYFPTCMAFAAAVFKGKKSIVDCPYVDNDVLDQIEPGNDNSQKAMEEHERMLAEMKSHFSGIDFPSTAERLGARIEGDEMVLNCLGKRFSVDTGGNIRSECHVNMWLTIPILDYVLYGEGADPQGDWVTLRELKGGAERYPLFQQMCEKPLKKLADQYPDLFEDIMWIFTGKPAEAFDADIALVLYPLPKVPILICYWKPEDELGSSVSVFFDKTADRNLQIGSTYSLGVGMIVMFQKIMQHHSQGA
jgi:hypothetical protein